MRVEAELTGHGAKRVGYEDELEAMRKHLDLFYYTAYQAFYLQREKDPKYEDTRTDYLLGRVEAIKTVVQAIAKAKWQAHELL